MSPGSTAGKLPTQDWRGDLTGCIVRKRVREDDGIKQAVARQIGGAVGSDLAFTGEGSFSVRVGRRVFAQAGDKVASAICWLQRPVF